MDQWIEIRRRVLVAGVSKRQIQRETGMHWQALEKILHHVEPPGDRGPRRRASRRSDPAFRGSLRFWMPTSNCRRSRGIPPSGSGKGSRTKKEFDGGYTTVKDAVRQLRSHRQKVFMPLVHRPGEAQVDYGHALANIGGKLRKVTFFAMTLPHSDAFFVMAFERECPETFWEGHVRAFEFFGGVPTRISYDNSRVAASKIVGSRQRRITQGSAQLVSRYLFDHHFCLVRRAYEKGVVEGVVKYARLNFFVPVPQVRDLDHLNVFLLMACRSDLDRRLRGQSGTKASLLAEEQAALRAVPSTPFDACRVRPGRANREALVRLDDNDYSVPVEYAHHPVTVRGYFDRVEIGYQQKGIAVHLRCWGRQQAIFEPLHFYSALHSRISTNRVRLIWT